MTRPFGESTAPSIATDNHSSNGHWLPLLRSPVASSAPEFDATAWTVERDFHAGALPRQTVDGKSHGSEEQLQTFRRWMLELHASRACNPTATWCLGEACPCSIQ